MVRKTIKGDEDMVNIVKTNSSSHLANIRNIAQSAILKKGLSESQVKEIIGLKGHEKQT